MFAGEFPPANIGLLRPMKVEVWRFASNASAFCHTLSVDIDFNSVRCANVVRGTDNEVLALDSKGVFH